MSGQSAFSADEWSRIVQSPVMAGFAVTAADPGGLIGAVQEAAAMAGKIGRSDAADAPLVAEIKAALQTPEGRKTAQAGMKELARGLSAANAAGAAVAHLEDVIGVVSAKAPGEAPALAAFLRTIAEAVAEAAKEGGFLGIGGEPISMAEHKTLADIDGALSVARA